MSSSSSSPSSSSSEESSYSGYSSKEIALAIAPKFTAFASILGSSCIIYLTIKELARQRRQRKNNPRRSGTGRSYKGTYHRLILGLGIGDLVASIAWFCTTWPIPKGTPDVYGAIGNQTTCSVQGFFTQFSFVSVMYNLNLSVYYVLVVAYQYSRKQIVTIEPYMHALAIFVGIGTATAMAVLGIYNPAGWDCWIAPKPLGCQETWNSSFESTPNCERGDNASLYRFIFYYGPLWIVIIIIGILMFILVRYVRSIEKKSQRHTTTITTTATPTTATTTSQQQAREDQETKNNATTNNTSNNNNDDNDDNIDDNNDDSDYDDSDDDSDGDDDAKNRNESTKSGSSLAAASTSIAGSGILNSIRRNRNQLKHTTVILHQALYYMGAFLFTWIFPTIFQITFLISSDKTTHGLLFITAFLVPIQGLLNLIVYLRPKFTKQRKQLQLQQQQSSSLSLSTTTANATATTSASASRTKQQQQHGNNRIEFFLITWFRLLGEELTIY